MIDENFLMLLILVGALAVAALTQNGALGVFIFLWGMFTYIVFINISGTQKTKVETLVQQARIELDMGNEDKMSELYQKALSLAPKNYWLYCEYGNANLEIGKYHKALISFNKALQISPEYIPAYFFRSRIYLYLHDYKNALHDCNKVISAYPDDPNYKFAYMVKGTVYIYLRKFNKALCEFNNILRIEPDWVWSYISQSETYCHWGKYELALHYVNKSLEIDPTINIIYVWRAWANYGLGNIQESLTDCNHLIEIGEKNPKILEILGFIHESDNNIDEALNFFEESGKLYKKYNYIKQYDEVTAHIQKIKEASQ